jgi:hypothetical protein
MANIATLTASSNSTTNPIVLDMTGPNTVWQPNWNFVLGIIGTVSSGANLTWTLQVTGDAKPSANGNWNNHDVLSNQTGSANSNIAYPVTAVRLVVTNYVSGQIVVSLVKWP